MNLLKSIEKYICIYTIRTFSFGIDYIGSDKMNRILIRESCGNVVYVKNQFA